MSEEVSIPYEWAKTLTAKDLELNEPLLFGYAPSFPADQFFAALASGFGVEPFEFQIQTVGWQEAENLKNGYNHDLFIQNFSISGIDGTFTCLMDLEDLRYLMHFFITKETPTEVPIFEEELEQGMYRYFALEVVRACNATDVGKPFSFHLISEPSLPEETSYVFDVNLNIPGKTISIRLILPRTFQLAYKEKHNDPSMRVNVSKELLDSSLVSLEIEIGGAGLTKEELQNLKEGDLLLLDRCYVDPSNFEGKVVLSYHNQPRLSGSIKGTTLTIEESSLLNEPIRSLMTRPTKE